MKDHFANADGFKIRTESLKDGHIEKIRETFTPDFIDVVEDRLSFIDPISVQGEAYLADADLVLHLDIETQATIACSICNEPVKVPIQLKGNYFNEPLDEIKTGVFSIADLVREAILIETPTFAECNGGVCPARKELEHYFKKSGPSENDDPDGYRPFENLKLDN